jgi:hypothetical protein
MTFETITLQWTSSSFVGEIHLTARDLIYDYSGEVRIWREAAEDQLAGRFFAYYVDVAQAVNEGHSLFELMDEHSDSAAGYFESIFGDNEPDFSDDVTDILGDNISRENLLVLDRLELLPHVRGRNI